MNEELTSRERFNRAINHQEPDKVPIDLGGHQTGIHLQAYKRVLDQLGIADKRIKFYDFLQQLPIPCEELLQRFGVDTRTIYCASQIIPENTDMDKEIYKEYVGFWDAFGVYWGRDAKDPNRLYFNDIVNPFADFTTVQQVKEYDWPKGNDSSKYIGIKENAKDLYRKTNYALIGRSMGSIFQWSHYLFGLKKAMKIMLRDKDMMKAALEGLLQYCTEFMEGYLDEVGDYVQSVQITSDLTDQKGPMISPKCYREIVKPYQAEFVKRIKTKTSINVNFHSCGAAHNFIDDLAEIGIGSLNPVQISANGMEPCSLKHKYGEKMAFWGGLCNSQSTLPFGTPDQIREEVKHNMTCLKTKGGYIAASIHNICYDVPAENIIAMFDAAQEFRSY